MKPLLSIIIVSFNTESLLRACLRSVFTHCQIPVEVIVVDNSSTDGSMAMVTGEFPQVQFIASGGNIGFGRANNLGFSRSQAPFILLLNSDAELLQDTGARLIEFLESHPRAGAVGPNVYFRDGNRQEKTYGYLPTLRRMINQSLLPCRLFPSLRFFHGVYVESAWSREMEVGWVSGVCVALRREAYAAIDGFDPEFFLYAEDLDLCLRLKQAGWTIYRVEDYAIRHWCAGSSPNPEKVLRNAVMQQYNFLKVVDRCSGKFEALISRFLLGLGLVLRIALQSRDLFRPGPRLMLEQYLRCLRALCQGKSSEAEVGVTGVQLKVKVDSIS